MVLDFDPTDSDSRLIEGCRAQHSMAQAYLYRRYFGQLLVVTYRYASDRQEAIGILNEAFLKVFQSIHRYEPTAPLRAWMRTIVVRTALNHLRSKINFVEIKDVDFFEQSSPLSNDAFLALDAEYILQAIQKLPDATRMVFNLYELEGYRHADIAELLNISVGTSKWHLSEAKNRLRLLLASPKIAVS